MGIQEINGKDRIQEYPSVRQQGQGEDFHKSLMQNLKSRSQESGEQEKAAETEAKAYRNEDQTSVGAAGNTNTSRLRVRQAMERDAVQTAEVRHMSYEESDHIEIAVTEGYTLKGKLEGRQVYVEAKYEDGRIEAYRVDTDQVKEQTNHKIEQFAMETKNNVSSGKTFGATDSVGIILRQMGEPQPGEPLEKTVIHKGVVVSVTKSVSGNRIVIGGSAHPDLISVSTSVGTVVIDLNDIDSLMKCLDMFSPEDINAILRAITKVRQTRDALREIDDMKNTPVQRAEEKVEGKEEKAEGKEEKVEEKKRK